MTIRYEILDNTMPSSLVHAAAADWPAADWRYWMAYRDGNSVKRASRSRDDIPDSCLCLLDHLAQLDVAEKLGLPPSFPDFSLHGAGLHEIPAGGWLARHRDSTHHPTLGWHRAASVVLFLNETWEPDWGGELVIGEEKIAPKCGRVVMFATNDEAFHEVKPVTGPEARRTMALFWWNKTKAEVKRLKAEFV